ncbi:MAG: FG-GAP repeat domain-containing protein, partial [Planctomycetota bacterium]
NGTTTKPHRQSERPAEVKKALNRAPSNFLSERIIFEDNNWGTVNSINRMTLRPDAGMELILGMTNRIVFLDESYSEEGSLNFNERRFYTIEPVYMDENYSCGFLGYRYGKGAYLFDSEGKEIWEFTQSDNTTGTIDGAEFGDIDGDGKTEFAVYYRYSEGIHLVNSDGKTRWKHPVYALGHLEIADLNGDGKAEIIYDNSNNANGITEFNILNAAGAIVDQMKIATKSYEFAISKWPTRESEPHILLTEDAKIRIVDLKGDTVICLDAPGCRPFGNVKAVTVKFKKDEPEYLAVKKNLHPDLSVLYVYDNYGKLVYQKTEVVEGGRTLALAVVPMRETGNEGLLVGAARNHKSLVLEYSLIR